MGYANESRGLWVHMGVRTGMKESKSGISVLFLCVWAEFRRGSFLVVWPADSWCHNKTRSSESSFEMLENIHMSGWTWNGHSCLLAVFSQDRVLSGMLLALREDIWRVGRGPKGTSLDKILPPSLSGLYLFWLEGGNWLLRLKIILLESIRCQKVKRK